MVIDLSDRRTLSQEHIIKGRELVSKQRELIARIKAREGDFVEAERLLSEMERSLELFEQGFVIRRAILTP